MFEGASLLSQLEPDAKFVLEGDEIVAWRAPGADALGPPPAQIQAKLKSDLSAAAAEARPDNSMQEIDLTLATEILALAEDPNAPAPLARKIATKLGITVPELTQTLRPLAQQSLSRAALRVQASITLIDLLKPSM